MTVYKITANGKYMGTYPGADVYEALDRYAADAGYKNFVDLADALEQTPSEAFACIDWDRKEEEDAAPGKRPLVDTVCHFNAPATEGVSVILCPRCNWNSGREWGGPFHRHVCPPWKGARCDSCGKCLDDSEV